jgi:3-oxoacyl-(acyl-carrier-protein) synthase
MALFAQYAMVASEEALNDAGWAPKEESDLEATVCASSQTVNHMLMA